MRFSAPGIIINRIFLSFFVLMAFGNFAANAQDQLVKKDLFIGEDSVLDADDLFFLSQQWGKEGNVESDLNQDERVNQKDLLFLIQSFHGDVLPPTAEVTPTPTPSIAPTPTATSTPTIPSTTPTLTPTPTIEPSPTLPPTPTLTPTPFVPQNFEAFSSSFDLGETLDEAGFITYESASELQDAGRMEYSDNEVIPWRFADELAISKPHSAAANSEDTFAYQNQQTSVLEIKPSFNTLEVAEPKLGFEIAYAFEQISFGEIVDFLVIEVKCDDQAWRVLDLNEDGSVVTSRTSVEEFDGFYSEEDPQTALEEADFQYVEVTLPQCEELRVAFRFESDRSSNRQGVYLDNVQVFNPNDPSPRIRQVQSLDEDAFYADFMGRAFIFGSNLVPAQDVIFTTIEGEQSVPFETQETNLVATLPQFAELTETATGTIQIVKENGERSNEFSILIQPAPKPRIDEIQPNIFFLGAPSSEIVISGAHFRPDSIIQILGVGEITNEEQYIERTAEKITVNAPVLKEQTAGSADLIVKNPFSDLESDFYTLPIEPGTGSAQIDAFYLFIADGEYEYDPQSPPTSEDDLPQRDQVLNLIWESTELDRKDNINISVAGESLVVNGKAVDETITDFFYLSDFIGQKIEMTLAPMVIDATGQVEAEIQVGNGAPVVSTFQLQEPLPPRIYKREGDWRRKDLDIQAMEEIEIFGDNYRGANFAGISESITRVYLFGANIEEPTSEALIELPAMDPNQFLDIEPGIADDSFSEDWLFQQIPANTVEQQNPDVDAYRIRLVNPDSGLYVDSPLDDFLSFVHQ